MSDTSPDMEAVYRSMVMARPAGGARFKIVSDMFDIARGFMIASIRAEKPGITEGELRQELLLRYYGNVFSQNDAERILAAIADYWARKEAAEQTEGNPESGV